MTSCLHPVSLHQASTGWPCLTWSGKRHNKVWSMLQPLRKESITSATPSLPHSKFWLEPATTHLCRLCWVRQSGTHSFVHGSSLCTLERQLNAQPKKSKAPSWGQKEPLECTPWHATSDPMPACPSTSDSSSLSTSTVLLIANHIVWSITTTSSSSPLSAHLPSSRNRADRLNMNSKHHPFRFVAYPRGNQALACTVCTLANAPYSSWCLMAVCLRWIIVNNKIPQCKKIVHYFNT